MHTAPLIDWDRPDWGGHVTFGTTDDLGNGRGEGVSDQ